MDALVGGRIETVAPRRVTDTTDRAVLAGLAVVAVAVHGWLLTHTGVTARDSVGFARQALLLESPSAGAVPGAAATGPRTVVDVLRESQHPPGYPVAVWVASVGVRAVVAKPLADQMLLATQVASLVAAVLLVFPTYWLGRVLFGKFEGFAAAVLFQILPVPAHLTSDGLTEAVYILTVSGSLLLGAKAVRTPGVGAFLLAGLASGAAYLVRPEGTLVGVAVGLVAVALGAARRWPRPLAAGRVTALAVGFLVLALPYMLVIGKVTNKPSGMGLFPSLMGKNPREQLIKEGHGAAKPAESPVLFAAWYEPATDGSKEVWVLKAFVKETLKAFYYVPAVLAVLGFCLVRKRLGAEPWLAVPLVFAGLTAALLLLLGWKGNYLSERHTLSVVYVGCLFAAVGVRELGRRIATLPTVGPVLGSTGGAGFVLAVLVAAALPAVLKPLHENRVGHVLAGRYLAEPGVLSDSDALIDPFDWAAFYSGRTLRTIPADPGEPRVRWAVLELDKDGNPETPHSLTPRHAAALDVFRDRDNPAEIAFRWPNPERPRIVLLKQTVVRR